MNNYLPTDYQSFIHKSRYAKYDDGKGRESWPETVERFIDNIVRPKVDKETADELEALRKKGGRRSMPIPKQF